MFTSLARKQAQTLARQLLTGHCTLVAWWTLRRAGIFDAILKYENDPGEGLDSFVHATRTGMAADVLESLLAYLATAGLTIQKKDGYHLTTDGRALFDHEDSVLELFRAYEPVLDTSEHLLAKLRTSGNGNGSIRKSEFLAASQAKRYATEVFPEIANLVGKHKFTHLLDLTSAGGELLISTIAKFKDMVGVGIGSDTASVRKANAAIDEAGLDKRLIAVTANPLDVCTDTERTFDRIGISKQLWKELDCLIAINFFTDLTAKPEDLVKTLAATRRNFPRATLLLAEPVESTRFNRNYYAPELTLLLRLSRATPWLPETWRETLAKSRYHIAHEEPLTTDGLTLFLCKPAKQNP